MDVGPTLASTPLDLVGIWPVSEPAGGAGEEWRSDSCNLLEGTSGVIGGCIPPTHQNRSFGYDQQDSRAKYYTLEAKIHSQFEGPFGFMLGASLQDGRSYGGYYVLSNALDAVSIYGSAALRSPPLFPGFFYNANNPESGAQQDGWATFGELYYDLSDRLKLTVGLRFNEDNKRASDTSVLFNSVDASAALGGVLGPNPIWLRSGLFGEMVGMASDPAAPLSEASSRMLEFWHAQGVYAANASTAIASVRRRAPPRRSGDRSRRGCCRSSSFLKPLRVSPSHRSFRPPSARCCPGIRRSSRRMRGSLPPRGRLPPSRTP